MWATHRWGGGAVERAGLENRYGLRVIVGSNPTPTVSSILNGAINMNAGPKQFPDSLKLTNHLLAAVSVCALVVGGTILIIMIWDEALAEQDWPAAVVGNMATLLACTLLMMAINRICGGMRGLTAKVANVLMLAGITACLVIGTLAIWNVTDSDSAWKSLGTIIVLIVLGFIFVPVVNAFQRDS